MEQNRQPRNKPAHLWTINIQQRRKEYTMEKRQSLQQVGLRKLDITLEQDLIPYTNSEWFKNFKY